MLRSIASRIAPSMKAPATSRTITRSQATGEALAPQSGASGAAGQHRARPLISQRPFHADRTMLSLNREDQPPNADAGSAAPTGGTGNDQATVTHTGQYAEEKAPAQIAGDANQDANDGILAGADRHIAINEEQVKNPHWTRLINDVVYSKRKSSGT